MAAPPAPASGSVRPDAVPASARLIAAWRALEMEEARPLFTDPLAAASAGEEALEEARRLAQPWPWIGGGCRQHDTEAAAGGSSGGGDQSSHAVPAAAGPGAGAAAEAACGSQGWWPPRRRRVSNVAARCWWFDHQLAAALASEAAPRQVVVLGAGYDTRPLRLALPPGVRWWELDLPEVVAGKRQQLRSLGAALEPGAGSGSTGTTSGSSSSGGGGGGGGSGSGNGGAVRFPLRAAAWASIGADLCRPGWGQQLLAAGLDPRQPTVWVAEGLLMYLNPQEASALLREAAALSAPGSAIIAHNITRELLQLIQDEPGGAPPTYAPFSPELVATWRSGFSLASDRATLAAELAAAGGWRLREATSRARIAAAACAALRGGQGEGEGGNGSDSGSGGGIGAGLAAAEVAAAVDFEARPDEGRDLWAVFFTAAL